MNNLEFNKIFAAVLVAGIVAMLGGFVSDLLVHPDELDKPAVFIESAEAGTTGGAPKAALPDPILPLIADADIARGEKLSKACAACHSFDNGGANKVGPNLWDVVGKSKGAHEGFAYSDGLHAKGGVWGYEDLNQFLWKPKKFIDGTKMNYVGLKKPEDRAALIAWLRTLSSSPKALPSAAEIAKEAVDLVPAEEEGVDGAGAEEAKAPSAESH
jgi:cytochrome c